MPASLSANESFETLVGVALKVAQFHGTLVSLSELVQLLPADATSQDLAQAIESLPGLSSRYVLRDGLVVPRTSPSASSDNFEERSSNSAANIRSARWLSARLRGKEAVVVAVSGSTSYKGASRNDDVDLFCVTRPGTMWVFLARALLLTRASGILRRSNVPISVSCAMDETYARTLFSSDMGPLIARDALVADALVGGDQYASLLKSARWMRHYFPKLYGIRTDSAGGETGPKTTPSSRAKFANLLLFFTLGSYIGAKAWLHNHVLAKQGRALSIFHLRLGLDHLVYESAKYLALKRIYDEIQPATNLAED